MAARRTSRLQQDSYRMQRASRTSSRDNRRPLAPTLHTPPYNRMNPSKDRRLAHPRPQPVTTLSHFVKSTRDRFHDQLCSLGRGLSFAGGALREFERSTYSQGPWYRYANLQSPRACGRPGGSIYGLLREKNPSSDLGARGTETGRVLLQMPLRMKLESTMHRMTTSEGASFPCDLLAT